MHPLRAADLEARISALEAQVPDCLRTAGESEPNTIEGDAIFEGCNVHVRNGVGGTGTTNERGNLIVGYNELSGDGDLRTGSHNLVIGPFHSYRSYGGMVVGYNNTISGALASVTGGELNTASGLASSISGGYRNIARGNASIVVGGVEVETSADAEYDTVIGDADGELVYDPATGSFIYDDTFIIGP